MRTTRFMVLPRNPLVLSKSLSRSSRRRWWSRASPSISRAIDLRWLVLLAILEKDACDASYCSKITLRKTIKQHNRVIHHVNDYFLLTLIWGFYYTQYVL